MDVRHVKHEEVVKILTSCTEKVTLVAYRERVINKKMRPMSEINGGAHTQIKTFGESTAVRLALLSVLTFCSKEPSIFMLPKDGSL